ncbi:MAG: hypothetical protein AAF959_19160 [Cyanobacteria bacterium P01_D01_bin.56]
MLPLLAAAAAIRLRRGYANASINSWGTRTDNKGLAIALLYRHYLSSFPSDRCHYQGAICHQRVMTG